MFISILEVGEAENGWVVVGEWQYVLIGIIWLLGSSNVIACKKINNRSCQTGDCSPVKKKKGKKICRKDREKEKVFYAIFMCINPYVKTLRQCV